jgi:predicted  nucleic acid-binding Zn-ribbon protein
MADEASSAGTNRPLRKQGEEAIGKFAQELLQSPVVSGAISTVFETRERATRAQEVAMSALNLPSAADIERLTRRVRSISQRIEGLEDNLDKLGDKLDNAGSVSALESRLTAIEETLARIETGLGAASPATEPGPEQTELPVEESA